MNSSRRDNQWLEQFSEEDRAFVKRFVLASGSLKEMAKVYGVSYPTVRLRLDRLIQKIQVVDEHAAAGPFERQVRALFADGRIDLDTMRTLLETHQAEVDRPPTPESGSRGTNSNDQPRPPQGSSTRLPTEKGDSQ